MWLWLGLISRQSTVFRAEYVPTRSGASASCVALALAPLAVGGARRTPLRTVAACGSCRERS